MKLLLGFDLEEYEKEGEKGFDTGYKGGKIVQDLLSRTGIPATFFMTASFFEKAPDLVCELSDSHEIAFHGLTHQDDYQSLSDEEAYERLARGKKVMGDLHIKGFRAPRMRPPSYQVLKKAGFLYSSSLHPTFVPGRYNHMRSPRFPFLKEGVLEIPVSVSPGLRLPLSWVWFRQLGVTYAKAITLSVDTPFLCIYFHPWEFVPLQGGVIHTRNTGRKMEKSLEKFLNWISTRAEPMKMAEFAEEYLKNL